MTRRLSYAASIREAHAQLLSSDDRVFVIGQGLWSPWYAGSSLKDLEKEFGRDRMIDSPVSENAVTAAAIGAAMTGMRPIVFHPRMDFMLLAVDPIVNQAANWSYLFEGRVPVPVVIRAVINRGGEQGAQHSQALHGMFAHIPGLKVVMPASAYDAKGLLIAATRDPNPVMYIDDRWLYDIEGEVPEEMYEIEIGRGVLRSQGDDLTIVALSNAAELALRTVEQLSDVGIEAELIDLRSIKPWDEELVCGSVEKTGRLLVVDGGWRSFGAGAEIAATVAEKAFYSLKAPVSRVCLPDTPAPTSKRLEEDYYLTPSEITRVATALVRSAHHALAT